MIPCETLLLFAMVVEHVAKDAKLLLCHLFTELIMQEVFYLWELKL